MKPLPGLKQRTYNLVRESHDIVDHELIVLIDEQDIRIKDLRTGELVQRTYSQDSPNEVLADLIKIVDWRRLADLENTDPESTLKDKLSFSLEIGNDAVKELFSTEETEEEVWEYIAQEEFKVEGQADELGDRYYRVTPRVSVTEDPEQELYVYLFSMYSNYEITSEGERRVEEKEDIDYSYHPDWGLYKDEDEDTMHFKALVTTQEIDYHQFLQEGIKPDSRALKRERQPSPNGFQDWAVITVKVRMIREEAKDNDTDSTGTRGTVPDLAPKTIQKALKSRLGFRKSHAIVIGINEYPGLNGNLKTPVSDAEEIAKRLKVLQHFDNVLLMNNVNLGQVETLLDWLKLSSHSSTPSIPNEDFSQGNKFYQSRVGWLKTEDELAGQDKASLEVLSLITDDETIKEKTHKLYLVEATETYSEDQFLKTEDSLVFYFAGHGYVGEFGEGLAGYLALTDAQFMNYSTFLPMDDVYKALSTGIECKHTLVTLDCCFAGQFRFSSLRRGGARPFLLPIHERRFERYKSSNAWQVLTSVRGR